MANLRDIRKRIRSVKNTQQITRAMKMVAAAKLRRAQEHALGSRPYAEGLLDVLSRVAVKADATRHPLLRPNKKGFQVLVVVSSDRGLCGGFNSNLLRRSIGMLRSAEEANEEMRLYVIGRKGRDFFKPRTYPIASEKLNIFAKLGFGHATIIGNELMKLYLEGGAREVVLLYNHFRSLVAQDLRSLTLLPVVDVAAAQAKPAGIDYLYEPDPDTILEKLLPLHVHNQVYHALLESWASEQAARMMAMDSATKNAGEMIERLTLTMNKIRQANITRELIEVVSGAGALQEL